MRIIESDSRPATRYSPAFLGGPNIPLQSGRTWIGKPKRFLTRDLLERRICGRGEKADGATRIQLLFGDCCRSPGSAHGLGIEIAPSLRMGLAHGTGARGWANAGGMGCSHSLKAVPPRWRDVCWYPDLFVEQSCRAWRAHARFRPWFRTESHRAKRRKKK